MATYGQHFEKNFGRNTRKYIIVHISEHQACCQLIIWLLCASGLNVPNVHLPIPGVGSEMVNQNIGVLIFKSEYDYSLAAYNIHKHATWYVYQPCNKLQFMSETQNILTRG